MLWVAVNSGLSLLQLPTDAKLSYFDAEGNMQELSVGNLTKGKKVRPALRPESLCRSGID